MGQCYLQSCSWGPTARMGASFLPVLLFSAIWGVVGLVLPFVVPRGPHKSVIQVSGHSPAMVYQGFGCCSVLFFKIPCQVVLMITAACCWLFWLCCYVSTLSSCALLIWSWLFDRCPRWTLWSDRCWRPRRCTPWNLSGAGARISWSYPPNPLSAFVPLVTIFS